MRSHSIRLTAGFLVLGLSALSLTGCSKDRASEATSAVAESSAETSAAAADPVVVADSAASDAETTAGSAATATTKAGKVIGQPNIVYTAVAAGSFLTLASLLAQADLLETMKSEGPFTVFAPTDAAFAAIPKETLAAIAADKAKLTKVLTYHVVAGRLRSTDLVTGQIASLEGSKLSIVSDGLTIKVGGATIATPDVGASNGVIQVIDTVLLPPDL